MKLKTKYPFASEERMKTRFLFFPRCIIDRDTHIEEWRWLEKATWIEHYQGHPAYGFNWIAVRWIDDTR